MQFKFDVFISYSSKDKEFADPLYDALTSANLRIWMDRGGGIRSGAQWEAKIRQGLKESLIVLVLISPESLKSKWVDKELGRAEKLNMDILPVQIAELEPDADYRMCLDGPQWIIAIKDQSPPMLAHIAKEVRQYLDVLTSSTSQKEDEPVVEITHPESDATEKSTLGESTLEISPEPTLHSILNSQGRRESRLFNAVREGAADVASTDRRGQTALHYAVSEMESDVISLLIERGADINARDNSGASPLHLAIEDVTLTRWLLMEGADFEAKNTDGSTPLNYAQESNNRNTIHLLELWADVKNGRVQPNLALREALDRPTYKSNRILDAIAVGADDTTMRDKAQRTALHWAAQKNEADLVKRLLERGADINAKGEDGNTPLMLAHEKGCSDVEEILHEWDAKQSAQVPDAKGKNAAKNSPEKREVELPDVEPNAHLQTALMGRGRYKGRDVLRAIRNGASEFALTSQAGETALHWAARENDAEAVAMVLAGNVDVEAVNNQEQTALELANDKGFKEVVALLANAQLKAALSLGQGRSKGESKSEKILRIVRSGVTEFALTD